MDHGDTPYAPISPAGTAGPPRFLGNPRERALLYDPGGISAPGPCDASMQPSAFRIASAPTVSFFRGSTARPAHSRSTLREMDLSTTTQDLLPAGGQPLPGRFDHLQGPTEGFSSSASSFSRLAWRKRNEPTIRAGDHDLTSETARLYREDGPCRSPTNEATR